MTYLKEVFKSLDHNGDGCLNLEELRDGLQEMKNGEELLQLLKAADTDRNGTINYTGKLLFIIFLEFIAATLEAQVFMREENLRNAFAIFD